MSIFNSDFKKNWMFMYAFRIQCICVAILCDVSSFLYKLRIALHTVVNYLRLSNSDFSEPIAVFVVRYIKLPDMTKCHFTKILKYYKTDSLKRPYLGNGKFEANQSSKLPFLQVWCIFKTFKTIFEIYLIGTKTYDAFSLVHRCSEKLFEKKP